MNEYETKHVDLDKLVFSESKPRLRAYLGHVVKGNDVDYRTPLFDGKPRDEVMEQWSKILEPKLAGMEGLLKFENDLRAKVGPLSIMKPLSERQDDIKDYYTAIHQPSKPVSEDAKAALLKQWRGCIGGIRKSNRLTTWSNMKKSTSAGLPIFQTRSKYPGLITQSAVDTITTDYKGHGVYFNCAMLGWRGQEGGPEDDDVKQRVIWMFPAALNNVELGFYQPLIKACQRFNLVPAWNGNSYVDEEITRMFDTKGKDDVVICTDFSKFDHHFNADMQNCAYDVLKALGADDEWLRLFGVKFRIPLFDGEKVWFGDHGMASGSGGTNPDETLSHACLQHEAAITAKATLNPHSQRLGDDGLLTYPGICLDHIMHTYTSHGQEMNESKQEVSKLEATYLRRWYSTEYRLEGIMHGVYSSYRALGKLMGQERFYDPKLWGPEMVVLRSLSIIQNLEWHPAREEFLEFCVQGDKYRLGLDIPGFMDNIDRIYESNDLAQTFGSYTIGKKTGISQWWVVRALRGLG